ncbi:MAG: APC family permease [Deltaproteobacteria bacterium]|nr:APC family permease [Deltaproteobacteria bacterium]
MDFDDNEQRRGVLGKVFRAIVGAPRSLKDPELFRKMSLIPVLAWIGLGADGLSSSAYGPEEAFLALGSHTYLAVVLAFATALTVFIISYAYTRIIEVFPHGGGGYIVASHMLGEKMGVVSGCALLVDYVLTITVSIAACSSAIFSFIPLQYQAFRVPFAFFLIVALIVLNIRGVKESIAVLTPIFVAFVSTHALLLLDGIATHTDGLGPMARDFSSSLSSDLSTIGLAGLFALLLRAYSLGGGTYTGIEAVSNGLQIMREPSVVTGKRTMLYMAVSLSFTAGVLFLSYILVGVTPQEGKTLNAVLANTLFADWRGGQWVSFITIFSEGALLLVAAQTGFVDGPRVMSNMAIDSWLPHRFASLSERLSMQNGIILMGVFSLALLLYTNGSVSTLVLMYSINVFLTFSLSQLGMARFFIVNRRTDVKWMRHLSVHVVGLVLCVTILIITVYEKFLDGGWVTLLMTSVVVAFCLLIRGHYMKVEKTVSKLDDIFFNMPVTGPRNNGPLNRNEMTAIQLVAGYNGFGIHTLLSVITHFPHIKNFVFVSIAVIDSGAFKGESEIVRLEASVKESLEKYTDLARRLGFPADYRMATGTDVVESAEVLCKKIAGEFPRSMVFTSQLTFRLEKSYHRMLHNETAFSIQRRLHWSGITTVILPVRVKT